MIGTTEVSLVMPVWQPRRDWLHAAVESALGQRDCDLELIVVDDGCDPPVAEVLSVEDPRLRLVRIDHGGPAAARNAGFEAAGGRWVRFVDADDVVEPASTSRLLALAAGDEGVVAYGATMVCDEELRPRYLIASDVQGDAVAACLLGRFHVRVVSLLFSRRVLELAGPWDVSFRVSVDWDLVLRALEHASVRGEQAIATYYRRHERSVTRTADIAAGEQARARVVERYFERHPELVGTRLQRRAEAALQLDRGIAYAEAGQVADGLRRIGPALLRDPQAAMLPTARLLARLAARLRHRWR